MAAQEGSYLENQGDLGKVRLLTNWRNCQIVEFLCVNFPLQGLTSLDPDVAQLVHRTGAGLPNKPIFSSTRFCLEISGHTFNVQSFHNFQNIQQHKVLSRNIRAHINNIQSFPSPDNPLLDISAQEYLTLQRF